MKKEVQLKLLPEEAAIEHVIKQRAARLAKVREQDITDLRIVRRSVDARGKQPFFQLRVELYIGKTYQPEPIIIEGFQPVDGKKKVIIVGAGPGGYFAALELI